MVRGEQPALSAFAAAHRFEVRRSAESRAARYTERDSAQADRETTNAAAQTTPRPSGDSLAA